MSQDTQEPMTADATPPIPATSQPAPARTFPTGQSFEASLAPREGDLLSMPFDQYGRMRIVQNIAHAVYTEVARQHGEPSPVSDGSAPTQEGIAHFRLRVLDVGGYPGVLRSFLTEDYFDVTVLDVVPLGPDMPWYVQGSGMEVPFGDGSFDLVTALDTLEHIPGGERSRFLSEIMRVAGKAALLINPVQSVETDLAEETLNEYIRWILDAQQEQLAEHRGYGLPDFQATISALEQGGLQTVSFPTANVYNWLFMMLAKHYLISLRDEKASGFERTLDRFYNLSFSDSDHSQPAYRGVVLAVKPGLEAALEHVRASYPPVTQPDMSNVLRLQLSQLLMSLLGLKTANHEDRLLRAQIDRRDRNISQMETRIALQDVQLDRANAEVRGLQDTVERLQDTVKQLQATLRSSQEQQNAAIAHREAQLAERQKVLDRLEQDVLAKNEHILYLERLLQNIQSGRVMKATRAVSRFLGRG